MVYLQNDFGPDLILVVLVPVVIAIAALALRLACSFSAVEPPDILQAVLSVLVIILANVALQYFLHVTQTPSGLGSQLLAPLLMTTVIIAISLPTSPFSALVVTVSHLGICIATYYGLLLISEVAVGMILI